MSKKCYFLYIIIHKKTKMSTANKFNSSAVENDKKRGVIHFENRIDVCIIREY